MKVLIFIDKTSEPYRVEAYGSLMAIYNNEQKSFKDLTYNMVNYNLRKFEGFINTPDYSIFKKQLITQKNVKKI